MKEHHIVTKRRALYYTIGGDAEALEEMWVVLHGLGQMAAVFINYFKSIESPNRLIVAPEALNRHYILPDASTRTKDAKVGATWMTRHDRDNEIADYVDFLDAVYAGNAKQGVRVTVLGFSQGVATACRWFAMGHSRIDRLIAWAGQLPPDVDPSLYGRLSGGLTLVHGTTDEYAPWIAEGDHNSRLTAAGITPSVVTFDGGHRMDRLTLDQIATT